jgi:pantoate--beta-alanine ligase
MHIFHNKASLIDFLNPIKTTNTSIGFIPTMGALHQGHLSLMQKSLSENQITVVSIFVNPTQFNNQDDLAKYPRTIEEDIKKIKELSPHIIVFTPTAQDVYDGNITASSYDFDGLENQMEGKFRPGHFDGVGTVVQRLFEIVQPTNAYFGEKDFQQLQIIKKMVSKKNMNINIVGCPIYREPNQLAMSSRNKLLSLNEKQEAAIIFKILQEAKKIFETNSATKATKWVEKTLEKNTNFKLEYFQIADEDTLLPCLRKQKNKKYRAFIAVFINKIRLIDTISLN